MSVTRHRTLAADPPGHHPAGDVDDVLALSGGVLAGPIAAATHLADHIGGLGGAIVAKGVETVRHRAQGNMDRRLDVALDPLVDFAHVDEPDFAIRPQLQEFVHRDFRNCHVATLLACFAGTRDIQGLVDVGQCPRVDSNRLRVELVEDTVHCSLTITEECDEVIE